MMSKKNLTKPSVNSLFIGKSTKEMSGDQSTFTGVISGIIFFYAALLVSRQDVLEKLTKTRFMMSYVKGARKKSQPLLMRAALELKAARWLSGPLEEALDGMDESDQWLGSEDMENSPILNNLGAALISELRIRISAYSNKSFQAERAAEWKVLEQTTPALRRGGRRSHD